MSQNLTSVQKHDLKKLVKQLKGYRGSHTELVTVYVPAGYDLTKIIQHLSQEQGTATNIKSSSTRKNVIDALERMIQHLKLYDKTPPNGLAAFSGNVSEREGQSDVKVFSLEPPLPLNVRIYRCDKTFITEPIEEMVNMENIYALVVLDKRDGCIALLRGTKISVLLKTHSEVPGKTRAGGQSAPRFARLREIAANAHYRKISDYMTQELLAMKDLKGIILGGPGVTINDFIATGYITGDLQRKILAIKDLSYTDEFGLQELVDKSEDVLANEAVAVEKKVIQQFFTYLATKDNMVAYGKADVMEKLQMAAVDKLIISESLSDEEIEQFEEVAKQVGTEVIIATTDTREGEQLREIGKVIAILRYAM
jgi:peptide chain release factor subunit 1